MTSVLIVDDEQLVRRGLRLLLDLTDSVEAIAEAADGDEALAMITRYRPEVVLTDAVMPGLDGVGLIEQIRQQHGDLPVIMLTTFDEDRLVRQAIASGADGFLLKDTSPGRLAEAVAGVASGRMVIDPRVARAALLPPQTDPPPHPLAALTRAERAVAELVPQGLTNAEIAKAQSITEGTAKNHISALLHKLHCRDRVALVLLLQQFFDPHPT